MLNSNTFVELLIYYYVRLQELPFDSGCQWFLVAQFHFSSFSVSVGFQWLSRYKLLKSLFGYIDIGDKMCWWQFYDVGDDLYEDRNPVPNIQQLSPTSSHLHHDVTNITFIKIFSDLNSYFRVPLTLKCFMAATENSTLFGAAE